MYFKFDSGESEVVPELQSTGESGNVKESDSDSDSDYNEESGQCILIKNGQDDEEEDDGEEDDGEEEDGERR